ncbi:VOC family protein [Falsiroseomonas oryzae]|uniref:VOC family protein n=1 Tax=Falsiroseomonas oryzae TaxID=2766473 RepID=UPI0022EA1642|nr:VOC family protein [Roseomonas sp. MO-31]
MPPPYDRIALDHVVLRVEDLDRMVGFYRDVLGCEEAHRQDALGLVHLRAGPALIDLVWIGGKLGRSGAAPDRERPNLDHLCLAVSPWDEAALRAHLAAHGVEAEPAATRYGGGGPAPSIYFRDPEGNAVEIRAA